MIGRREAARWAQQFGVAVEQIRRDHLVSHVLAVLPGFGAGPDVVFVGGTALARTHLDGLRVSEDIDLLVDDVSALARVLTDGLQAALRRDYPDLRVAPSTPAPRGRKLHLAAGDVSLVELQLMARQHEEAVLEFELRPISLRYEGLPGQVELTVPTAESFVAMKVAAFRERQEPRDLFDLAHLARRGAVTSHALDLVARLTAVPCQPEEFRTLPRHTASTWHARLAHQTGALPPAEDALTAVREAAAALAG